MSKRFDLYGRHFPNAYEGKADRRHHRYLLWIQEPGTGRGYGFQITFRTRFVAVLVAKFVQRMNRDVHITDRKIQPGDSGVLSYNLGEPAVHYRMTAERKLLLWERPTS